MRVSWPAGEAIPQSIEQALASGWKVDFYEDIKLSRDELSQSGLAMLVKHHAGRTLSLAVPFTARLSYGKPRDPQSRARVLDVPSGRAAS